MTAASVWFRLFALVGLAGALLVLVGATVGAIRGYVRASRRARRFAADRRIPLRRWCQAACMLVTRDCDFGHLSRGTARRMLQRWWHVHGERELEDALEALLTPVHEDHAWELLRYMLLARLGAAAGMIDPDISWARVRPVARRLQRAYDSWGEMGRAYVRARRRWRQLAPDGTEDDEMMIWVTDNLRMLEAGTWAELPFALDLFRDVEGA